MAEIDPTTINNQTNGVTVGQEAPQITEPTQAPIYTPPEAPAYTSREIAPEETVEGRLSTLLDKENPYIKTARTGATEYALSRGLQNTSIAAGAGERAAIEAAMPIAQQDAQTAEMSARSAQEATQLAGVEGFRGEISSGLSEQEAAQKMELEQMAQESTGTRQDKETYAKLSSGIQQEYQNKYMEIQSTADSVMDAGAKIAAIEALNKSTQSQQEMLSQIYDTDITWSGGITETPTAPPAGEYQAPAFFGDITTGTTGEGTQGATPYEHFQFLQNTGLSDTPKTREIYSLVKSFETPEFKAAVEKNRNNRDWLYRQTDPIYNALIQEGVITPSNSSRLRVTGIISGWTGGEYGRSGASPTDNLLAFLGKTPTDYQPTGDGDGGFGASDDGGGDSGGGGGGGGGGGSSSA